MIITRKDNGGIKIMSNVIYAIPDFIGWTIVGVIGALCFVMLSLLAAITIEEIKNRNDNK